MKPAKGAFHHPAPGQQLKALGLIAAFDDFQGKATVAEEIPHLPHPSFEFALIAAVGKDQGHAQKQMAELAKEDLRAIPVLHAGRSDMDAEEQALGIGQEVAFAPFDFLSRVEAAAAWGSGDSAVSGRGSGPGG